MERREGTPTVSRKTLFAVAIGAWSLALLCFAQKPAQKTVSFDGEVRPALESAIVVESVNYKGQTTYVVGDPPKEPSSALSGWQSRIASDMADILGLYRVRVNRLFGVALEKLGGGAEAPKEKLEQAFRRALLSDEAIQNALAPRIKATLASEGLQCASCKETEAAVPKAVLVKDFMPYVIAFLWPTGVGPDGGVQFHICVSLNGLGKITNPDPLLTEAAFHCLSGNQSVTGLAMECMRETMKSEAYKKLGGNEAKVQLLRDRLAGEMPRNADFISEIQKAAAKTFPLYGLSCSDCATPAGRK